MPNGEKAWYGFLILIIVLAPDIAAYDAIRDGKWLWAILSIIVAVLFGWIVVIAIRTEREKP